MTGKDEEADVLGDVFASNRDRGADSAAPEVKEEVTPEPEAKVDDQPEVEGEQEAEPSKDPFKQYRDPESGRLVPLHELKSERTKRQEEARLREAAEKRAQELEQRYQEAERRLQQAAQPPQQPIQPPDMFADPEGYTQYQQAILGEQLYASRVALSNELLADKLPEYNKTVDYAIDKLGQNPIFRQRLISHPLPGKYAYEEGKRLMAMERIGPDPDAFEANLRKQIAEETRAQVLAELKAGGAQKQPTRFPGTLADATASGAQGAVLTDEAMMQDVFGSERRSRKRG